MLAGRKITALAAVFACAHGAALAAIGPALTAVPSGPEAGSRAVIDEAYYLSTVAVEQMKTASSRMPGAQLRADGLAGLGHVPHWGRFEIAIVHPRPYTDPYRDVTLEVTFTRPDGSTLAFWGFYDGDDTWRLAGLADQAGTWRYQARFSDGTGQIDGVFTCIESDWPGIVCAYEDNPIWFAQGSDRAVFVRCLAVSEWFLADDEPGRAAFLDWMQSQGYNALSITRLPIDRDDPASRTLALWDAGERRPDPVALRRLETVLDDLAARRIIVYLSCVWGGPDIDFLSDPDQQDLYLRYTLARLASYPNIVWVVDGAALAESGPIDTVGRKIKALDPFGHLICVTGDDALNDADWLSCSVLRGPRTVNLRRLSRVLQRNYDPTRPLYVQSRRAGTWLGDRRQGDESVDELRKSAYVLAMSGATVELGDPGVPGLNEQGGQARHDVVKGVWDFFGRNPFWRFRPHQDLVDNGYCLAEPDRAYLVYLPEPGAVTVDVGEGMYQVKWINARDTAQAQEAGILEGRRRLTSPQDDGDWLLSLTRVEIVAGEIRPY